MVEEDSLLDEFLPETVALLRRRLKRESFASGTRLNRNQSCEITNESVLCRYLERVEEADSCITRNNIFIFLDNWCGRSCGLDKKKFEKS